MKTVTMIDRETIAAAVTSAISEIQRISGRDPSTGDWDTRPIGDLDGFDSYCSIEATVLIEERLGATFDLESIFISQDWRKALTISEIVDRVRDIYQRDGG